jgi:hypothetical protein
MKLVRGNYEGASEFAQFDAGPVEKLTAPQTRALLAQILFLASPGYDNHERNLAMLSLAEDIAKEHSRP